ncbi:heavy metal translocating P-type ATPase [Alicyclobacillus ferrooxydans]|uniref:P-type Cu(+) transporter n=1 Tax=Alicyclobacillus ferrooxydans TaxID=471514 RepID=A0A0P9ET80_9BACL|nr:cation-translocating P-type ATPase [Alicyclobacillus ferrooxydans]KPV41964.1 hypothetical protein AN477_19500 [Alicyclobacillus ferrooxydans]
MAVLTCHLCEQQVEHPVTLSGKSFCCHGCRDLWQLLGEEQIVELKGRPGVDWSMVRTTSNLPERTETNSDQHRALNLHVTGLWCASCGLLVEHVVNRLPGVVHSQVSCPSETLEVSFDPVLTTPSEICEAVSRLGYGVASNDRHGSDGEAAREGLTRRFAISLTLSLVLMMVSIPIWSGYLREFPQGVKMLFISLLGLLTTPIVFWAGFPFLRGAWTSLRHRVPTMDLLITVASLAAYFYSVIAAVTNEPYVYFDTCGFLVTFLLLGRLLESGTRERALAVTRGLANLTVSMVNVLRAQGEEQISVEQLRKHDFVVVRPGDQIAVDGIIREGSSDLDESFMTGESLGVTKGPGDMVYAGTTNYTGQLVVENIRDVDDTVLAQTLQLVQRTLTEGQVYRLLTDRLLRIFVPAVFVVAVLTFCVWNWITPVTTATAVMRAVATLVIACPCALSVAAPVTSQCAVSVLGKAGILLRSNEAIERGSGIGVVVFDKTGTLTQGHVELTRFYPADLTLLQWAASAEVGSEHPYGRAVVAAANANGVPLKQASNFRAQPGTGVSATVAGHQITVQRYRGESLPPRLEAAIAESNADGGSLSVLWIDGTPRTVFCFRDTTRPDALETVQQLQEMGLEVHMATGDREEAARHAAENTGILIWRSGLTPVEKADYIRALQATGRKVAYVGDGVNDAAALLQSDLGIAMGSGTDIAVKSGHLVLMRTQLSLIPRVLKTCRQAVNVTRQNLAWAVSYNVVALIAAAVGFARPAIAAAAMVLSSAFVLGNALRLLGDRPLAHLKPLGVVLGSAVVLFVLAWYRI